MPHQAGGGALTALSDQVAAAFAPGSALASGMPGWQRREGQVQMASEVADCLERAGVLVAEAGTGVGKTLAYLVPLLLSGCRGVLSTSSHVLQAQLAERDIPTVSAAMGLSVRTAVLKGRSHYLCNHRLRQALRAVEGGPGTDPRERAALATIGQWAQVTQSGDFAELPAGVGSGAWRIRLGSTTESCLGSECPSFGDCHLRKARVRAENAEWLIVNHHLFFAEALSDSALGVRLLVDRSAVVFDEAHRLPEISREMLGLSVGGTQLLGLCKDLAEQGPLEARGLQPWALIALSLERATVGIQSVLRASPVRSQRVAWVDGGPEGVSPPQWALAVAAVGRALQAAHEALSATAAVSPDLRLLQARTASVIQDWWALLRGNAGDIAAPAQWLSWEVESPSRASWRLVQAPVAVTGGVARWIQNSPPRTCSWIFTSATLGNDASLDWFTRQMALSGMPGLKTARYASPFHQPAQMALYIPADLQGPSDSGHSLSLADRVGEWSMQLGGGTLVLTTTVKAARRIAHRLRWSLQQKTGGLPTVLDETQAPRHHLLEAFRLAAVGDRFTRHGDSPNNGAVMVASMGFWEGVDLPGNALELLVIDKLPFPPPDDPLIQARALDCERRGDDAFEQVYLGDAALALKQGAGRLIRSCNDQGVLVIADRRLVLKRYGPTLLSALPPHRRLVEPDELTRELQRLAFTRASTRDRPAA